MAKLILREACFVGIDNAVVREIQKTPEHKSFVKKERHQIEKNRLRYAKAYDEAKSYLNL